jgi:CRP-like cAMP-binding protein
MSHVDVLQYAARFAVRAQGLLASLPAEVADGLLDRAQVSCARAGDAVIAQGDARQGLWLCAAGVVRLSRVSATGRRRILSYVGEGGCFGVAGAFLGASECDAHAHTDVTLLHVPHSQLLRVLAGHPCLATALLQHLSTTLAALSRGLADARAVPLDAVMATELLALLEQHGGAPGATGAARIQLPLVQTELGELIGYSRQHVNASIKRLERRGLVEFMVSGIVVRDVEGLRAVADGACMPAAQNG